MVWRYDKCNSFFIASCNNCEKLMLYSKAFALSHAGKVTVLFTALFLFAKRTAGIKTSIRLTVSFFQELFQKQNLQAVSFRRLPPIP